MRSISGRLAGCVSASTSTASIGFASGVWIATVSLSPAITSTPTSARWPCKLAHLVVREIELFEACGNLFVGQVATLLTFRDQLA